MILPALEVVAENALRRFERQRERRDERALGVLEFARRYERITHRGDLGEQIAKRRLRHLGANARLRRPCADVWRRSKEAADAVRVALLLAEMTEEPSHDAAQHPVGRGESVVVRAGARQSLRADV